MKAAGILVLLILLGGAAFFGYQKINAPNAAKASGVATQTPAQMAENAASFDKKVATLQPGTGSKQDVSVVLTQDEVNAKVAEALSTANASGEMPVKSVTVKLGQDAAVVTGVANLGGQELPVEAQVKVGANGGLLDLNVTSLKAAGVPVPDAVKDQLIQQAETAMGGKDLSKLNVGIDLKSINLADGKVTIDGQTR